MGNVLIDILNNVIKYKNENEKITITIDNKKYIMFLCN